MCLMKVKEEPEYNVPARVRTYKRSSRRYSSPPRYYDRGPSRSEYDRGYDRYSSSRVVEERRPPPAIAPPPADPAPLPPPPFSSHSSPPPPPTFVPPPPSSHHTRATSRHSRTSRAPTTATRTHYVEVEHDDARSDASSSSSDDLRSRTTHKTAHTHKSHRTSASSHRPPQSEWSVHEREKEIRRERGYSRPRGPEYETFRYVNAPPDDGYGSPRRSQGGYYR